MHEDFRTRLRDLTRDELQALFTLGVPPLLVDLGMGAEAKGAMLKLAAGLRAARSAVESDIAPHGLVAKGKAWYVVWRSQERVLIVDSFPCFGYNRFL